MPCVSESKWHKRGHRPYTCAGSATFSDTIRFAQTYHATWPFLRGVCALSPHRGCRSKGGHASSRPLLRAGCHFLPTGAKCTHGRHVLVGPIEHVVHTSATVLGKERLRQRHSRTITHSRTHSSGLCGTSHCCMAAIHCGLTYTSGPGSGVPDAVLLEPAAGLWRIMTLCFSSCTYLTIDQC